MRIIPTNLKEVLVVEPNVFPDKRGFFMETYHEKRYSEQGLAGHFVQDNLSFSAKGILRGLHYQYPNPQAKLIQVIQGEVFDVAVDIRKGSPTFGLWSGVRLSGENRKQLYIPEGFAHGFAVLSENAAVWYKCSDFYSPDDEKSVLWNDPELNIDWPLESPLLSEKDKNSPRLRDIEVYALPVLKAN